MRVSDLEVDDDTANFDGLVGVEHREGVMGSRLTHQKYGAGYDPAGQTATATHIHDSSARIVLAQHDQLALNERQAAGESWRASVLDSPPC